MTVKEFIGTLESSDRLRIIEGKAEVYVGYLAAFKPFADHEISEEYRKYSGHEVKKFRAVPEITHRRWKELGLLTNFIKDYHVSAISAGLAKDGEKYIGVVYNPYLDEMFTAERGKGAFLNGRPIHVSRNPLSEGIVLFGTAPYYEELSKKSFQMAYAYFKKALDVRRSGSAAIDLCSIAAGRAELFFELRLSPWDFAAGALIVEEAGGVVTTVEGGAVTLGQKCSVLATNGRCGRLE